MTRRIAVSVLGFVAVFLAIMYVAAVVAISTPVDWPKAVSIALLFAPIGLFAGTYPEETDDARD